MTTSPTTAERIRNDEEIPKAQSALDTAQKGLHVADEVMTRAENVKTRPWAKAGVAALFAVIILAVVLMVRDRES